MRDVMRVHHVFVGGSLPLTMFSPLRFKPDNADLFVASPHYQAVVNHLVSVELYEVDKLELMEPIISMPTDPADDEHIHAYGAGVSHVTTLRRGHTTVHVLVYPDILRNEPRADVVTLSWSTLLFNVVGADFATCAYPALTGAGRGLFHMDRFLRGLPGSNSEHAVNRYAERGFEFARHPIWWTERPCGRGWSCPFRERVFGDGGCLSIPASLRPRETFGRIWRFGGVASDIHEE